MDPFSPSFCFRQILTLPSERLNKIRDSSDQATFSSLQLQIVAYFPICSGDEWYLVGSSAVVASRLCVLWLLKCFSAYIGCNEWLFQLLFSLSCSSISLNQLAHIPLTSSISNAFSPTGLPHTGCFPLVTPFFVNPRNGCA